ncbi:MAG: C39 family peptidase [Treponema sp.]|nr:C39 family peptidase [Treponema sp.]
MRAGQAVQLCLVKPGHYIAAVAYDDLTREIIFNDPWPGRFPGGNGFNRRMGKAEFKGNVKPFLIVYGE